MSFDLESDLKRELRAVADGVRVPALPALPSEPRRGGPRRTGGRWLPLLVAAAVVLIIAGAVAVATSTRDGRRPAPAPPEPRPTRVATTPPTVPYVLAGRLYVDGERVPGEWSQVWAAGEGWIAVAGDYESWSWGNGPEVMSIEGAGADDLPTISPDGDYVGYVDASDGMVTGFETATGGEGFGGVPVELAEPGAGDPVRVRAVTDDGLVVVQGLDTSLLWRPLVDGETVDLSRTAPGVRILGDTPAGLVAVEDGDEESPFLAELSAAGEVTRLGDLPAHDDLATSPDGEQMVWTPLGSTGGEVASLGSLEAGAVDGSRGSRLDAPSGWGFAVRSWVWEDDDHLVALVLRPDGGTGQRLARCAVEAGTCVLIEAS